MKIYGVNCGSGYGVNKPSFGTLRTGDKANALIENQSPEVQREVKEIEKKLQKSKYWDMDLDAINGEEYNFYYTFINKKDDKNVHVLGIRPYKIVGNKVKVRSIVDHKTDRIEELTFPDSKKAQELMELEEDIINKVKEERKNGTPPIVKLRRAVRQLELLDQAYAYMDKKGLIKPEPTYIDASPKGPNANYYLEYIFDGFRQKQDK